MGDMRAKVLQTVDHTPTETVTFDQFDVTVEVRGLTGRTLNAMVRKWDDQAEDYSDNQAELIIATAYDPETGERLFEDADRDQLAQLPGQIFFKLFSVAQKLSGLGDPDELLAEASERFKSGT